MNERVVSVYGIESLLQVIILVSDGWVVTHYNNVAKEGLFIKVTLVKPKNLMPNA